MQRINFSHKCKEFFKEKKTGYHCFTEPKILIRLRNRCGCYIWTCTKYPSLCIDRVEWYITETCAERVKSNLTAGISIHWNFETGEPLGDINGTLISALVLPLTFYRQMKSSRKVMHDQRQNILAKLKNRTTRFRTTKDSITFVVRYFDNYRILKHKANISASLFSIFFMRL